MAEEDGTVTAMGTVILGGDGSSDDGDSASVLGAQILGSTSAYNRYNSILIAHCRPRFTCVGGLRPLGSPSLESGYQVWGRSEATCGTAGKL